jgi:Tfp pilus assembly protein PilZ
VRDRRHSSRIEVVDGILGHIRPDNIPITPLNVSHGGFLMQSPINYALGDTPTFRFTIDGQPERLVLRGRVAHVMRVTMNDTTSYVIGVEFVDHEDAAYEQAIDVLVSAASHSQGHGRRNA